MADAFFDRFAAQLAPAPAMLVEGEIVGSPPEVMQPMPAISLWSLLPKEPMGFPLVAWGGCAVFLVLMLLMFGSLI
jgi:hypothetical protein